MMDAATDAARQSKNGAAGDTLGLQADALSGSPAKVGQLLSRAASRRGRSSRISFR
jgi:hypothetical protein